MIDVASQLFIKKGVKQVTVDEIAKELSISKKTIYHFFETKSVLIDACVSATLAKMQKDMEGVKGNHYPPVQEMLELGRLNKNTIKFFSKNTLSELKKYYPQAWEIYEKFKSDFIFKQLFLNLEKGIQSEDYRSNLQVGIVTHIYMSLLESAMMQHSYLNTDVSLDEVYREHLLMHIYSICSDTGRVKLEQLLKNKDYF
ncbi:MAG: TetR/AcrR family transcriptional regulator [Chitinophagales bacterium]|nr:TetR/AcrR family transcriptional regulator [Chitinophagales bacterium]